MINKKVAVLMSGGVDSSTAAYLLKKVGYEVVGVYLKMFSPTTGDLAEPFDKVKTVCRNIDIPFYCLDVQNEFKDKIINNFVESYKNALTPNPCVVCNKYIKFGIFMDYVINELNVDNISSGHYANIEKANNRFLLKKARDPRKDQSYVLYTLKQDVLSRLILPLGLIEKTEVRQTAKKLITGLDFGEESEDLCFVEGNYKKYLKGYIPEKAGFIIDRTGKVLGKHFGTHLFTIGQREGLGISNKTPLYVIDIDSVKNNIIVGEREEAFNSNLIADNINFIPFDVLDKKIEVSAKVRYKGEEKSCTLEPFEAKLKVTFNEPQFAITKGQSIVFYDNDYVIGGGIIKEVY
jgi:tRNA-uridine 2-sulfurtransferase